MCKQSSSNTRWKLGFLLSETGKDGEKSPFLRLTCNSACHTFCRWAGKASLLFAGRHHAVLFTCFLFTAITIVSSPVAGAIDCFKCVSLNGNNPSCEDPFHNNFSASILESPCMGGRKGRNGLFPATACIKISGKYHDTGETIIVRGCALDSGTLTTDTEIVRMSHCGGFYFDERYIKGCLQSCEDADGCNSSNRPKLFISFYFISFPLGFSLLFHRF